MKNLISKEISTKLACLLEKFKKDFHVDDKKLDALNSMASNEGVKSKPEDIKGSSEHLRIIVKALIARDSWSVSEYYEIINEKDDGFEKAVHVFKTKGLYESKLK